MNIEHPWTANIIPINIIFGTEEETPSTAEEVFKFQSLFPNMQSVDTMHEEHLVTKTRSNRLIPMDRQLHDGDWPARGRVNSCQVLSKVARLPWAKRPTLVQCSRKLMYPYYNLP